jgi:glycosyltransferase involved in cell wall biosynthesis
MNNQVSALFVTYSFPPSGGSGVQRVYKFVKYLPSFGVATSVLTAKNFLKTTADASLLTDLDPNTVVIRTSSFDPMFVADFVNRGVSKSSGTQQLASRWRISLRKALPLLLKIRNFMRLPDQYIAWFPFAFIAGLRHIKTLTNPVIVASLPVYTTALVAYYLSKWTGAPLVMDFRDAWTDDPYLELPTRLHRYLHNELESKIVGHAKHIVVYGEWLRQIYLKKYPHIPTTVILNGFDSEDFKFNSPPMRDDKKIRLVYSGSIFQYHLEFIEMTFAALQQIKDRFKDRIELVFAGDVQLTSFDDLVIKYELSEVVTKLGYIAHKDALKLLVTADALLFTIPRDDVSSYTGKIFEYLAARRPIISFVCEQGLGGKLLKDFGHDSWIIDYDLERAAEVFNTIDDLKNVAIDYSQELFSKIERKQQAYALSLLLRDTAIRAGSIH